MDHFTDHYEHIGNLLRLARSEMGLTITEASQQLHIRVRYLKALEEGRLGDLPGIPYAKGYLQTYAAFLGLDKDEVLRRFEQVEAFLEKRGFFLPESFYRSKTPGRPIILAGLCAVLLVYVFWAAITPRLQALSVVEPFEKPAVNPLAELAGKPCIKVVALYPACTTAEPRYPLLPLSKGMVRTIMELPF